MKKYRNLSAFAPTLLLEEAGVVRVRALDVREVPSRKKGERDRVFLDVVLLAPVRYRHVPRDRKGKAAGKPEAREHVAGEAVTLIGSAALRPMVEHARKLGIKAKSEYRLKYLGLKDVGRKLPMHDIRVEVME